MVESRGVCAVPCTFEIKNGLSTGSPRLWDMYDHFRNGKSVEAFMGDAGEIRPRAGHEVAMRFDW
ncbi:hypothetical protein PM082_015452 [Marasmius tenuissimus]|nr:hypothetical protein PM082_015452 [Marasmius tenuissimus]